MDAKAISILMSAAMLTTAAPLAVSDTPMDDDRELTYAGTTTYDHGLNEDCEEWLGEQPTERVCPAFFPSGIIHTRCDYGPGVWETGIDGIGGGTFCQIQKGTTVTLTLHDEVLEHPAATVTCPFREQAYSWDMPAGGPTSQLIWTWSMNLGEASPALTLEVPEDCLSRQHGQKSEEATHLNVIVRIGDGTTGTVTLEHH